MVYFDTEIKKWRCNMNDTLKKMLSYYKPHRKTFIIDMIFAFLSAAVTLVIPIIIRYVTSTVIHQDGPEMFEM